MSKTTNEAKNVTTGKPKISGAVFVGEISKVTIPENASDPLGEGYVCLGYVSEAGLSNSNDMDVSSIKEWGGAIIYRSLNELTDNFKLSLLESNSVEVLKAVYGDECVSEDDESGEISVDVKAGDPQEKVWVFELALRGNKMKRIVIPDGAITERDEITYNASDAIAYGVTISAYPDSDGSTHKEYIR